MALRLLVQRVFASASFLALGLTLRFVVAPSFPVHYDYASVIGSVAFTSTLILYTVARLLYLQTLPPALAAPATALLAVRDLTSIHPSSLVEVNAYIATTLSLSFIISSLLVFTLPSTRNTQI